MKRATSYLARILCAHPAVKKRTNPKNQSKSGAVRNPRPPCANSRISPRHSRPPPPPSFATPFLTSPSDQCTPAGAADDGVRGPRSTAHCTFARFHSERAAKGPGSPLQFGRERNRIRSFLSRLGNTRGRVASLLHIAAKNHVTRNSPRIARALSLSLSLSLFSILPH